MDGRNNEENNRRYIRQGQNQSNHPNHRQHRRHDNWDGGHSRQNNAENPGLQRQPARDVSVPGGKAFSYQMGNNQMKLAFDRSESSNHMGGHRQPFSGGDAVVTAQVAANVMEIFRVDPEIESESTPDQARTRSQDINVPRSDPQLKCHKSSHTGAVVVAGALNPGPLPRLSQEKEYCLAKNFVKPPANEFFAETMRCHWCKRYPSSTPWICDDGHQLCNHCMNIALTVAGNSTTGCPMRLPTVGDGSLLACGVPIRPSFSELINEIFSRSEFLCPFYGCKEVVVAYHMTNHTDSCPFGACSIECYWSTCGKLMHVNDYFKHLESEHHVLHFAECVFQFNMEYPPVEIIADFAEVIAMCECFQEKFIIVKRETKTKYMVFCLVLSKDPEVAVKYHVKFDMQYKGCIIRYWTCNVYPITHSIKDLILSGGYSVVPKDPGWTTLLECSELHGRKFWPLEIQIIKNCNSVSAGREMRHDQRQLLEVTSLNLSLVTRGEPVEVPRIESASRMKSTPLEVDTISMARNVKNGKNISSNTKDRSNGRDEVDKTNKKEEKGKGLALFNGKKSAQELYVPPVSAFGTIKTVTVSAPSEVPCKPYTVSVSKKVNDIPRIPAKLDKKGAPDNCSQPIRRATAHTEKPKEMPPYTRSDQTEENKDGNKIDSFSTGGIKFVNLGVLSGSQDARVMDKMAAVMAAAAQMEHIVKKDVPVEHIVKKDVPVEHIEKVALAKEATEARMNPSSMTLAERTERIKVLKEIIDAVEKEKRLREERLELISPQCFKDVKNFARKREDELLQCVLKQLIDKAKASTGTT